MYRPGFELSGFDTLTVQRKQIVLRALLEALVVADWNYIWHREQSGHGSLPSIYTIAPQYVLKVRPAGIDSWQDIPRTLELGSGDCKDFACWRIAELRHVGYDDVFPHIKVTTIPDPKGIEPPMTVYHIQVRVHEIIEDPSAVLGMPTSASYDQLRGDDREGLMPPVSAGVFSGYGQQPFGQFGQHQFGGHPQQQQGHPQQHGNFGYHQPRGGGIVNQFGHPIGMQR